MSNNAEQTKSDPDAILKSFQNLPVNNESFTNNTDDTEELNSDGLPEIINFGDLKELPELAPELISGVLRKGHKMLISGPSKAGKSFLLIELAVCIASGRAWLGFDCKKGRVLYINLEVDEASFLHRIDKVCKAMGLKEHPHNLDVWNLRGMKSGIKDLEPRIIHRLKDRQFDCIIFDPIYKINLGDENNASETGDFFNRIDSIGRKLNASVILCHHHSKGAQGNKFTIDRSSGSGVFARDPDALLDMIQLNTKDVGITLEDGQTAWRISSTLREFRNPEDIDVYFDFPLHRLTYDLVGAEALHGADSKTNSKRGNMKKQELRDTNYDRLCYFVENWNLIDRKEKHTPHPSINDAVEHFKNEKGFSKNTIYKWIDEIYPNGKLKRNGSELFITDG